MSWQIVPLTQSLGAWHEEWGALNQRLYGGHPFRDSGFVEALLKHFGSVDERLCIHRTQDRIDGMLILRYGRLGVWRQFVPSQAQAAPVLLEHREMLQSLFGALSPTAWMIEFYCQDPQFAPEGLLQRGATTRVLPHALTMNVALKGTFETYWSSRSKNLAKNMRRYKRRANEAFGIPELRIVADPEAMHDAVMRYGALESAGWKGKTGTAVHIESVQGAFYADLLRQFAQAGQAEVIEYWLGEKLAASRLVIRGGDMAIIIKTAYDESLSSFAPGRLLLQDYLERAFALQRKSSVEFYTDATPDQLAWATSQRQMCHLMVFRMPWLAQAYDVTRWVKRGLGAAAQENKPKHQVDLVECFVELPAQSLSLFKTGESENFDLSADWFRLLSETSLQQQQTPRYYQAEVDGVVQVMLPLLFSTNDHRVTSVTGLTNFYTTLYRPLIVQEADASVLAAVLRQVLKDTNATSLRFDAMDPEHPSFSLLHQALRQIGLAPFKFFAFGNWYLEAKNLSWETYFNQLPGKHRNTLKRLGKKFTEAGGRFKIVADQGPDLEQAIQAYAAVYAVSWKVPEPFPNFIPGFIKLCAQRGCLRLGLAYMHDQPVAAQFWIVMQGKACIYKVSYDEKFSEFSPGSLLTGQMMRHVIEVDQVQEVDYLIGDDAYKKIWMSHRRERWGIVAYNPRTIKGLWGAGREVLARSVKWLLKRVGMSRSSFQRKVS